MRVETVRCSSVGLGWASAALVQLYEEPEKPTNAIECAPSAPFPLPTYAHNKTRVDAGRLGRRSFRPELGLRARLLTQPTTWRCVIGHVGLRRLLRYGKGSYYLLCRLSIADVVCETTSFPSSHDHSGAAKAQPHVCDVHARGPHRRGTIQSVWGLTSIVS